MNPLRVKLCWKSEWLNLNIFHFMHPAASRQGALLMSWTLLYDTDYQQLLSVCVCVCVVLQFQTVGIQLVSVFGVFVLTSCIFTDCHRSVIMDFRLLRGDLWCLFVCRCEKLWQMLLSLSHAVDSSFRWLESETWQSLSSGFGKWMQTSVSPAGLMGLSVIDGCTFWVWKVKSMQMCLKPTFVLMANSSGFKEDCGKTLSSSMSWANTVLMRVWVQSLVYRCTEYNLLLCVWIMLLISIQKDDYCVTDKLLAFEQSLDFLVLSLITFGFKTSSWWWQKPRDWGFATSQWLHLSLIYGRWWFWRLQDWKYINFQVVKVERRSSLSLRHKKLVMTLCW